MAWWAVNIAATALMAESPGSSGKVALNAAAFKTTFPELPGDSAMSAVAAIFTAHHAITELRRMHGLRTQPWVWLDQTATTLLGMMLADLPEEEGRMWEASLPVVGKIQEIAA